MADYTVLVTDRNLNVVGDPITTWESIDVTLRWNEPSSGSVKIPGYPWVRDQFMPGNRIVVIRDQSILIAGPMEKRLYERSDDGDNAGHGNLTVDFADDLASIAAHCTYPNPALTPSAQVTDAWTYTGNAEVALRQLVDGNAGASALTARKVPQLVLGNLAGVGTSITSTADRMEPITDVMRRVAVNGGGLGFRTRQVGQQILFEVFAPPDLSNQVFFGFGLGNLKYIAFDVTAPTVSTAIVGGQGEGADRFLLERTNDGATGVWGRMEKLVSRPGNDPTADLNAAGDEALADGKETARVQASASDIPTQQYGTHYDIGTRVSVESWPGSLISDIVTTVHLQVEASSNEYVSPTIGSQAESADPAWVQRLRAMDKRVGYLERNVVPAVA